MRVLLLLLAVLTTVQVFGGLETYSERMEGSEIFTSGSSTLFDDKYFEMISDPSGWQNDFVNHKVRNTVTVGLNAKVLQQTSFSGSVNLQVKYYVWDDVNLEFDEVIENKVFQVEYDVNGMVNIVDHSRFTFDDAHKVVVTITGLTGVVASSLYIESQIEVERYYAFQTSNIVSNLSAQPYPASGASNPFAEATNEFIDLSWDFELGAESYELEYVHINDYTLYIGAYISLTDLSYDYYQNSTRVELSNNYYRVPNIYDHGYFIFRVRPIYRGGSEYRDKIAGEWSAPESGKIDPDHPMDQVIYIDREYDSGMNWGHQVAFTEEGRRFESVSFADGLGRGRQNVARNSVTEQTIVSNVYFDEIGRVVVSDLPTPIDLGFPTHQANFNRADASGLPTFNYTTFDDPSTSDGNCVFDQYGMSDQYGTSRYYSTNNPDQNGANGTIPDAENFPYSRVHYLNDFTGRMDKTAAEGPTLTLGAGHETQFVYVTATQAELFQLFGEEVGDASHYQKMITIDPNGQVYVQYSDMAGRVIATYMMGPSPENLDELEQTATEVITTPIMTNGSGQIPDLVVPSATMTFVQYFAEDLETYTMDYAFTKQQYESICLEEGICFDCVYDLKLKIQEKCGTTLHESSITLSGGELDAICNEESAYQTTFALEIPKGEYTFTKTLSVNQEVINEYWCMYIDNITEQCLPPMNTIFDELYNQEAFPECDDEEYLTPYDEAENCDLTKLLMASDITPGGQYARYSVNAGVYSSSDPTSIFYGGTPPYTTFNYGSITVMDPVTSTMVSPAALSMENFILLFDETWATYLIENEPDAHPESCMLGFCDANADSYAYDQGMLETYSFDDAISYNSTTDIGGYFLPLSFSTNPSSASVAVFFGMNFAACDNNNDPFFATGGMGAAYAGDMEDDMHQYIELGQVGSSCFFSIWEYAVLSAYVAANPSTDISTMNCGDIRNLVRNAKADCNKDLVWAYYRKYYLELKKKYFQLAQEEYAANNCPSMPEIGTGTGTYANKWPRFPSTAFINNSLNNVVADDPINYGGGTIDFSDPSSATDIQNLVGGISAQGCSLACEEYSHEWMQRLAGCNIDPSDTAAIRASFLALCMNGCDQEHPGGASTPNPNSSYVDAGTGITNPTISDILAYYGYNESTLCSELLIDQPLPYDYALALMNSGAVPLDECTCDKVLEADHDLAGSGFTYVEELFEENTGVYMDDIDYLICECEEAGPGIGGWHPGYSWPSNANTILAATAIEVPSQLACPDSTACVDCSSITPHLTGLLDRFGFDTEPSLEENYALFLAEPTSYMLLTNYLNHELNFLMEFDDYAGFIGGCLATPETPYCTVNPLFEEVSAVLKLISYRGQLTSAATIDLMQENIVFANSLLMEQGFGRYFSANQDGNELALNFSDGSNSCKVQLTIPGGASFGYEDIVSFGYIFPTTTQCEGNENFQIEVNYFSCGVLQTALIDGYTDCFEVNLCVCGDEGQTLCNDPYSVDPQECYQPRLDELYDATLDVYQQLIADQYVQFKNEYNAACAVAFDTENYSYTGPIRMYQYTLFYYDQAGNLVQTVAPEGVDKLIGQDQNIVDAQNDVNGPGDNSVASIVPAHDYITSYAYNSYDQLTVTTNPDQDGNTRYWYDRYGRVVASQNPVQAAANRYTYTIYDEVGRPLMVGQTVQTTALTEAITKADDLGTAFVNWANAGAQTEITLTIYDQSLGLGFLFSNGQQENLRLRVASVLYYPVEAPLNQYESAIHYSYDIHGNVKEQIQDVPMLAAVGQDKKSTQYNFELISGNIKKVFYQMGEADQLIHEYHYDELNRLTEVETSIDDVHYTRDAHYHYYDYGPLSRIEYGEYQVQGQDFAYTINGWIKGMNGSELRPELDMGRDGEFGYLSQNEATHRAFAVDVTAYTLSYFESDYHPINQNYFEIDFGTSDLNQQARNLYNGNIRSLVNTIYEMETVGKAFHYDQLNRLKDMQAYYYNDANNHTWDGITGTEEFYNAYTYDKNGNINTLKRNGLIMNGLYMDQFDYNYVGLDGVSNTSSAARSNRLDYVIDSGADDSDPDNIGDIKAGMSSGNYKYDALGQLIQDNSEGISSIQWRNGDKRIAKITRSSADAPEMQFFYNPFGQRVVKVEKPRSGGILSDEKDWIYTYYAYDANGQVMAVYTATLSESENRARLSEQHIYGSSRLGMINRSLVLFDNGYTPEAPDDVAEHVLAEKFFELSNYLGNVEAVINDRKIPVDIGSVDILFDQFTVGGDLLGWQYEEDLAGAPMPTGYTLNATGGEIVMYTGNNLGSIYKPVFLEDGVTYTLTYDITAMASGSVVTANFINDNGFLTVFSYSFAPGSYSKTVTGNGQTYWIAFTGSQATTLKMDNIRLKAEDMYRYEAVVIRTADYYPFGMEIRSGLKDGAQPLTPGGSIYDENDYIAHVNSDDYRYAYNGMEHDNEVKGHGNSYTTEFRQYDPRLGRWMSLDPLMAEFPWMSPYVAFDNNPIYYIDPYGLSSQKNGDKDKNRNKGSRLRRSKDPRYGLEQDLPEVVVTAKRTLWHKLKGTARKVYKQVKSGWNKVKKSWNGFWDKIGQGLKKLDDFLEGDRRFVDDHWVGNSTENMGGGIDWRKNDGSDYSYDDWNHFSSKNAEVEEMPILPGSIAGGSSEGGAGKYKQKENWATKGQDLLEKGKDHPITRAVDVSEKFVDGYQDKRPQVKKPTQKDIYAKVWRYTSYPSSKGTMEEYFETKEEMMKKYPDSQWNEKEGYWECRKTNPIR